MSVRSLSSLRFTAASATMTFSVRRATSASASTMSMGAMVPISTLDLLLRRASRARSSDWRATCSAAPAAFTSQYAYFTLRIVVSTVWRNSMSETSRFILLTISWLRAESTLRFRRMGCVKLNVILLSSDGFGLSYTLLDWLRLVSQPTV